MTDDSGEPTQHAAGLAHGFRLAVEARKRVAPMKVPDMQRACAEAVRDALEAAVVETLYSDRPEEFLDGLLLAQRTLTARPVRRGRSER